MLSFLKENCGIGAEKGRHISKRGQKIIPGQLILQLHVERNSPSCDQPSSSKRTEKENIPKKKQIKKEKPKKIFLMTMTGYVQAVEMVAG